MLTTIKNFCDDEKIKNGLFLLDMPTGFGKTYSVLEYIYNASVKDSNANKKFFFITTLKKNLPKKELEERFIKNGKSVEFNEKFLFIDSNADCVVEHLTADLIKTIPESIKHTEEYKALESDVKFIQQKANDKNADVKRIVEKIKEDLRIKNEPKFRQYVSRIICNRFSTINARLQAIKMSAEWQWLGKLYPAVFTRDKQIIFMSINKFLSRNATIVEPSYMFYNSEIVENAVIFIDEFDATKETVLKIIIQNGLRDKVDFLELFRDIYAALQIKEFPKVLTTASKRRNESEYANQSLQSIIDGFKEKAEALYANYHLQFSHRTNEGTETVNQNFLFQDHVFHSVLDGNKNYITTRLDDDNRINCIDFTKEKPSNDSYNIFIMLGKLRGFVSFFQRGINILAINYLQLKQENRHENDDDFSRESAIRSVLSEFRLKKQHIDYLTSAILTSSRKTNSSVSPDYDLSLYEKGFRYFSFENDYSHDMQSQIMMCAFQNTPEKILLRFCEKAKIVGISATATIPSVVGNYDIEYIKSRLQNSFYEMSPEEKSRLKFQFKNHTKGYEKININVDFVDGLVANEYSVKSWEQVFKDRELAVEICNRLEQKQSFDTNSYNKERYVRIALAYKNFIIEQDIQSFLCMLTKHPRKHDAYLDIDQLYEIFEFIVKENQEYCPTKFDMKKSVVQLDGEEYDDKRDEIIKRLSKGEKLFVISVYQTMGAGQNIQYPISKGYKEELIKTNEFASRNEKDFDAIYLDKPTNILVNLENGIAEDDFVKYIFQAEFLQEKAEISSEQAISNIKKAFRCFATQTNLGLPYAESMYRTKSVISLATRTIIQAIGRICRTNIKNQKIYIFADERLTDIIDPSVEDDRLLNPEFIKLLQSVNIKNSHDFSESSPENAGSLLSVRVNTFINNMLREDWTEDRIKKWRELREIALRYPTVSEDIAEKDFRLRNLYVKLPMKSSKLYYQQEGDYSNIKINFSHSHEFPLEVSEQSARLSTLLQLPGVKELFIRRNWALAFTPNDYIQSPALFNNIYKGALGEVVGCLLLKRFLGVFLEEIENTDIFECFDFKVKEAPIYVDFKHWQEGTAYKRDEMLKKIFNKLNKCNGKCALIINVLSDNYYEIRKTKLNDKLIIEIPSFYQEKSQKVNEKAFTEIRECINEFSD